MNVYGGYQIVDFKGNALSSTKKTITGTYNAIKNANNKPIYVQGLKISTTIYNDCFLPCFAGSNKYTLMLPTGVIEVTNDDGVKWVVNA